MYSGMYVLITWGISFSIHSSIIRSNLPAIVNQEPETQKRQTRSVSVSKHKLFFYIQGVAYQYFILIVDGSERLVPTAHDDWPLQPGSVGGIRATAGLRQLNARRRAHERRRRDNLIVSYKLISSARLPRSSYTPSFARIQRHVINNRMNQSRSSPQPRIRSGSEVAAWRFMI
jgi:hypothetical protein